METLFNTLHITAAVFIVGPMAILPMSAMRMIRAGEAGQVAGLAKSVNLFTLLSIVVALFGFGALAVSEHHTSFGATWVWLSVVLYLIALAVNLFVVVPAMKASAETIAARPAGEAVARPAGYSRIAMGSGISSLLLVIVVVLMVAKPGR